jgi:ribosomal protein S18 acetylase RimI-like enzyme
LQPLRGYLLIDLKMYKNLNEVKALLGECMWPDDDKIQNELNQYFEWGARELFGEVNDDKLVGLIGVIYETADAVELKHIAIHADFRGKGIGSKLINEFIKAKKIVRIKAETDQDAVGFYKKMGFAITSLGEKYAGVERFECVFQPLKIQFKEE